MRYYKHLKAAEYYKNLYVRTTIPIIITSSITTILASFNGSFTGAKFSIAVAVFSGLTTIGQSLTSFLEYNTKYDTHINSANKFIALAMSIETEVFTNYYAIRASDGEDVLGFTRELLKKIQKDFGMIQDVEPYIPSNIQNSTYKSVTCGTSDISDDLFIVREFVDEKC